MAGSLRFALACATLLFVGAAGANPIAVNGAVAVQVPGSTHVQVSYLSMDERGGMGEAWPTGLKRDGADLKPEFLGPTAVSHNGGSGVATYYALQYCDCFRDPGEYEYEWVGGADWGNTASVYVAPLVAQDLPGITDVILADPGAADTPSVDAGSHADLVAIDAALYSDPGANDVGATEEVFPWDEPEPAWPQGVDCRTVCEGAPPGDHFYQTDVAAFDASADYGSWDAASLADPGASGSDTIGGTADNAANAGGDDWINPEKKDDEPACNAGAAGNPSALLAMAAMALALAARRRRS